jgi:hypothetical protein
MSLTNNRQIHVMFKQLLFGALLLVCSKGLGQIAISSGATITTSGNPDIAIVTTSNITNNSSFDFSSAQLHLLLAGTDQTITGNFSPLRMRIDGGGVKTMNGNLTITGQLDFVNGLVRPSASGKILFTGSHENLTGASESSYVDGRFFTAGSGFIKFPIGVQGLGFAPASIENAPGLEVGLQVINSGAGLTPAASEVELAAIDNTHYWEVTTDNLPAFNSVINLSLNGITSFGTDFSTVIVEANTTGGEAFNLGSLSASETSITSLSNFTRSILAIGASTKVDIRIHDMISPFTADNINDELYIENIGKFPVNTVTLLDRWGVLVKEWTNFTNFNDPVNPNQDPFNFTKLSPGNYICVVEYESATQGKQKKSQMITVLKIN